MEEECKMRGTGDQFHKEGEGIREGYEGISLFRGFSDTRASRRSLFANNVYVRVCSDALQELWMM